MKAIFEGFARHPSGNSFRKEKKNNNFCSCSCNKTLSLNLVPGSWRIESFVCTERQINSHTTAGSLQHVQQTQRLERGPEQTELPTPELSERPHFAMRQKRQKSRPPVSFSSNTRTTRRLAFAPRGWILLCSFFFFFCLVSFPGEEKQTNKRTKKKQNKPLANLKRKLNS